MGLSFMDWFRRRKPKPKPVQPPVKPPAPIVVPVVQPTQRPIMGWSTCPIWARPRPEYLAVPGVECSTPDPWGALLADNRKMAIGDGTYDEAAPAVSIQYDQWNREAGTDFVSIQIGWAHEHTLPAKRQSHIPHLSNPLLYGHILVQYPLNSPVEHFVSWWDAAAQDVGFWRMLRDIQKWNADDVRDSHRQCFTALAQYMTRPNYKRIDGRPVVMRGHVDLLEMYRAEFGIDPLELMTIARDAVRKAIGAEIYFVATAVSETYIPKLKSLGFDCRTQYLLHGDGWDDSIVNWRTWVARDLVQCRQDKMDYWMPVSCGYDAAAWGNPERFPDGRPVQHIPTPEQFRVHLIEARKLALDNYDLTRAHVIGYANQETGEGGILYPMQRGMLHDGDAMLRVCAEVCA